MRGTALWASRDVTKDYIKVWDGEPVLKGLGKDTYVGKNYLGMSCLDKWPGPPIDKGQKMPVVLMVIERI
jgi:hypothetical protein